MVAVDEEEDPRLSSTPRTRYSGPLVQLLLGEEAQASGEPSCKRTLKLEKTRRRIWGKTTAAEREEGGEFTTEARRISKLLRGMETLRGGLLIGAYWGGRGGTATT